MESQQVTAKLRFGVVNPILTKNKFYVKFHHTIKCFDEERAFFEKS
jgi:uncharacterized protein YwbE